MQGQDILASRRLTRIVNELRDIRQLPQDLKFVNRYPAVPATDGEITARYTGNVVIADIVADDQKAVVRAGGKFSFDTHSIPNLKHGKLITQEIFGMLERIQANLAGVTERGIFDNYLFRVISELLLGIDQTKEFLLVACALDALNWDVRGIKLSGVSWGMPSDLKVTPSPLWTSTSATPIDNILALVELARTKYGEQYNRVTMSTQDFRNLANTDEFKSKSQLLFFGTLGTLNFPSQRTPDMVDMAGRLLRMDIELYDAQYWSESTAGAESAARYLPTGKVILSNSADDASGAAIDFAHGIVTETRVLSLADVGGSQKFSGPQFGPVSYMEAETNPAQLIIWAADRGFPRKKRLSSTAVLTVA